MDRNKLIPDILPGLKPWTCKVTVVDKQNARDSLRTPGKVFKPITLQDAAGNKVQAMLYDHEIPILDARLNLYSTYLITNAAVKETYDLASSPNSAYPYLWTLNLNTMIQDVLTEIGSDPTLHALMDTTKFSNIYDCICKKQDINVLALVIQKLPREYLMTSNGQKKAHEFVIIDEEGKPIILTLWESFATKQGAELERQLKTDRFPVVLAKRLKCDIFMRITLSTHFNSSIEINPAGQRVTVLGEWAQANNDAIKCAISAKTYEQSMLALAYPLKQTICKIKDLPLLYDNAKIFWIQGTIAIADESAIGFYVGCDFCYKRVHADAGINFQCMQCSQQDGLTVTRYKLLIIILDGTGSINNIVFTRDIQILFELCQVDLSSDCIDIDRVQERLKLFQFIVGLKRMMRDETGRPQFNYSVMCLSQVGDSLTPHTSQKKSGSHRKECSLLQM